MVTGTNLTSVNISRHYGKNGGFTIPPAPNMLTKGQCRLSEKDLVKKIVKLAQRDAASGKDSQYGARFCGVRIGTAEWKKLRDDYISLGSPDRMKLVQNTLSELRGNRRSAHSKADGRFDLLNMLFKNKRKSGHDIGGNFIKFRDEQGNEIAEYSVPNGWNLRYTPAESARSSAFYDLWNQALTDAQEDLELERKGESREFDVTV